MEPQVEERCASLVTEIRTVIESDSFVERLFDPKKTSPEGQNGRLTASDTEFV